jgi:LysR family hydrogen peroxide-inducible transcriptional activator
MLLRSLFCSVAGTQKEGLQHFSETQKAPFSYPLTVGMIPTVAPYILPKLLPVLNLLKCSASSTVSA